MPKTNVTFWANCFFLFTLQTSMDICHSNLLHVNKAQGGRDDGLDTPHRRQGEDGGWRYDRFDKNKKFLFVFIIIRIGEKIAQAFVHWRLSVVY